MQLSVCTWYVVGQRLQWKNSRTGTNSFFTGKFVLTLVERRHFDFRPEKWRSLLLPFYEVKLNTTKRRTKVKRIGRISCAPMLLSSFRSGGEATPRSRPQS